MRVRRLTELELSQAAGWWDELLSRSRADSFFLRHAWLTAWWRRFGAGRELRVLVAEEDSGDGIRTIGVAPLCLSRETDHRVLPYVELSFLGREGVTGDNLDFFTEPGREKEVVRAFLEHLLRERDWDLLRASDLPEDSPTLSLVMDATAARGVPVVPGKSQTCPFLPLPRTWDEFLASVSANLRSNLRRREKKLVAMGAVFEEVHGGAIGPALETLFSLHGARWATKGQTGNFIDPRLRAFHQEIAPLLDAEGALGFWTLRLAGRTVAGIYGFRHRGRFLYYQAGFDPACAEHGVGLALMGHAIRRNIDAGMVEFDYLRGDEEYKRRWTDRQRFTRTLVVARPNLTGLAWRALTSGRATAKRLLFR